LHHLPVLFVGHGGELGGVIEPGYDERKRSKKSEGQNDCNDMSARITARIQPDRSTVCNRLCAHRGLRILVCPYSRNSRGTKSCKLRRHVCHSWSVPGEEYITFRIPA